MHACIYIGWVNNWSRVCVSVDATVTVDEVSCLSTGYSAESVQKCTSLSVTSTEMNRWLSYKV